jgi:demethoxyubiquinone hydroxylase (CLK1/Coq7/Cat5 family)
MNSSTVDPVTGPAARTLSPPEPVTGAAASALTVYFDGACPVCSREIAVYRRQPGAQACAWIDASACDAAALGPQLDRERALQRMHVRRADGTLVSGAAAFALMWQALPATRRLGRVAGWPPVTAVLELAYRAFLRLRGAWRRPVAAATGWPAWLARELRSDHAGETGAVQIYRGILALARDPALRRFAEHHLATEQRHLARLEALQPAVPRSRLLALWRPAGWLTGALPALFGPRAVYATIAAVETFVDHHYAQQIEAIDRDPERAGLAPLRALLADCRGDELRHRDEALAANPARGPFARAWARLVGLGSAAAVAAARRL